MSESKEEQVLRSSERQRSLTEKGTEMFETNLKTLNRSVDKIWCEIETLLFEFDGKVSELSPSDLKYYHETVTLLHCKFISGFDTVVDFLERTHTQESIDAKDKLLRTYKIRTDVVERFLGTLKDKLLEAAEVISMKLGSDYKSKSRSSRSSRSSASTILLQKQIKAEGQKARLKYLRQEVTLAKQKALIDADVRLLEQQRETAVAEAEVEAIIKHDEHPEMRVKDELPPSMPKEEMMSRYMASIARQSKSLSAENIYADLTQPKPHPPLLPEPVNNVDLSRSVVSDLTSFLLKKDLLTSRFISFNDQPEAFAAWKTSFQSIITELHTTAREELDLLIKWLGPESKKFANSMKTANPQNPHKAVHLIWQRLRERYGSPELVEAALKSKLDKFPSLTNSDSKKLYDLADILSEIVSAKDDPAYSTLLSYFDSSTGILPIVKKLPYNIQEKWISRASTYKRNNGSPYPPFNFFVDFIVEMSQIRNDPGLRILDRKKESQPERPNNANRVYNKKTEVDDKKRMSERIDPRKKCPLHNDFHALNKCRTFRNKTLKERKDMLVQNGICFKCCNSTEHVARNCTEDVTCSVCSSKSHPSALHIDAPAESSSSQGGEGIRKVISEKKTVLDSKCSQICHCIPGGKSCSKTLLVDVFTQGNPEKTLRLYAVIDDQSNQSLAKSHLFDTLGIQSDPEGFELRTCSGVHYAFGRLARNLVVSSLDGNMTYKLPPVIECDYIPDNVDEIPTPEIAQQYTHLSDIADCIPPIDSQAKILLLIGRDLIDAHYVLDQRIGETAPYAQRLSLGWTIIGETCLNKAHLPTRVTTNKIHIRGNGRPSILPPCEHDITVKHTGAQIIDQDIQSPVFERTVDDDKLGLSRDDRTFLGIMENTFHRNQSGKWTAPLPFKPDRPRLPNNHSQAFKRARNLDSSLKRNPTKMEHALSFMQRIFENGHAVPAPTLQPNEECWYLPIFAVYHPRKPNKVRMVFDSSASYEGISLNSVLLAGPDLTNNLLGILMRFRKERIAITADIEQMFYCFGVSVADQNFLRFLWYKSNDPSKELAEYRMTVHVFGNTPSPSVATYGLRKSVSFSTQSDVSHFVHRNFYVDDALTSLADEDQAIDLLRRTQQALLVGGGLRLHKVTSNSQKVVNAFPEEDRAQDLQNVNLNFDVIPMQKSLGLTWDLQSDSFKFDLPIQSSPFTKRGMLSTLNSLYDPIGFIAPVVLRGKIMFRKILDSSYGWDDSLPPEHELEWRKWCDSLVDLANLSVPRTYSSSSLRNCSRLEVHVFCDASETAISAVAYLNAIYSDKGDIGFLIGKSKLAPTHGHTVPRLELCAAVLGSEIATIVIDNIDAKIDQIWFYSDSRIVLGYLNNTSRRFYTYVSNRVHKILKVAPAEQWKYVPSERNPADIGSRSVAAADLPDSSWIKGPIQLGMDHDRFEEYNLVDPDHDEDIRPIVSSFKTLTANSSSLGIKRFENFSSWNSLVRGTSFLRSVVFKRLGIVCDRRSLSFRHSTESFILKTVQRELLTREVVSLKAGASLPRNSTILNLNPYLDDSGILRVGGRLKAADMELNLKHPVIVPRSAHIARLIMNQHHMLVHHQGRHVTEGAVRSAGYWIVGGKRLISSIIFKCVYCRKLRGRIEHQKMADLPSSRLQASPPFSFVGVDAFGHWNIIHRKTRGGVANSKRWAILFTCLTSRASHIEVVEDMSSSSFINALRRFMSIRGKVIEFRSDRGTNFVGSTDDLHIDAVSVEDPPVKTFLYDRGCTWMFNAPHSSHMGGVWERIIGLARRVLDAILLEEPRQHLTHDILVTLMAEVCAILNNRPLVPVSTDPDNPYVLSPNMRLTQKTDIDIPPFQHLDLKDMYVSQWKRVQVLADRFWKLWRNEYLQLLQGRRKWKDSRTNLQVGDIVLLRDKDTHRNDWPMGVINKVFPCADTKVRKVELRIYKNGQVVHYVRPVTELVVLLPK